MNGENGNIIDGHWSIWNEGQKKSETITVGSITLTLKNDVG